MPFGLWTWMGRRNRIRWGSKSPTTRSNFGGMRRPLWSIGTVCSELCKNGWTNWDGVWMLSQMDPRNHALDGVEISPWEGAILRGKGMPSHAWRQYNVNCAKTAEPTEMSFGLWTRVGWRKHGSHWRHLANTIEPSMCGSDAALCQITLTTCYTWSLFLWLGNFVWYQCT